jgi:hypothetical protein
MVRKLLAAAGIFASLLLLRSTTAMAGTYLEGAAGYDISWPQCGGPYPGLPRGQFGIVGVNNGRPYTFNSCFPDELAWAGSSGIQPTVYVNLAYGETDAGPRRCEEQDHGCLAYNWGFGAARYAFDLAWESTGGEAQTIPIWWLDVETENTWSDDQGLNAQVIQGAIDYLEFQAKTPGVYSTGHQWNLIAGGFAPNVLNWVAGAYDEDDFDKCGQPLWPGGRIVMFQYLTGDYDQNVPC